MYQHEANHMVPEAYPFHKGSVKLGFTTSIEKAENKNSRLLLSWNELDNREISVYDCMVSRGADSSRDGKRRERKREEETIEKHLHMYFQGRYQLHKIGRKEKAPG